MNWIEAFVRMVASLTIRTKWTGYRKLSNNINLFRKTYTDKSTIGEIVVDGNHQCWSLEPTCRKQAGVPIAIPTGRYKIEMLWSTKFKMDTPHIQEVPGRTFIEIHPGNFPNDTLGCILLGNTVDVDFVGESRKAYSALVMKIESKLKEGDLFLVVSG